MIPATRFIETSDNRERWLAARRPAVTATEVALAATPAGFREAADLRRNPVEITVNDYMQFGTDAEPEIMRYAHQQHGILPSHWLIASETNTAFLATPDGLSLDHTRIAECKTTGKDWAVPPIKYRRQIQWQLFCTGAVECLLLWNLRVPDSNGWFYLGWLEPKTLWIQRDQQMIDDLVGVADRLLQEDF